MSRPHAFRGSIPREQWLAPQMRITATIRLQEAIESDNDLVNFMSTHDSLPGRTPAQVRMIARTCARRLDTVSQDPALRNHVAELIAFGTPDQLAQANLYAIACDNCAMWDFLTQVVARKADCFDPTLTQQELADFFEGLRTEDSHVAHWSNETMRMAALALTTCLVEAGLYDSEAQALIPPMLDLELEEIIRANGDEEILPAFGALG